MDKPISKELYEQCKKYEHVKRPRIKRVPGYFGKDGEFVHLMGWHATLAGDVVAVSKKDLDVRFNKHAACYYSWNDAKKAAYIFLAKCKAVIEKYESENKGVKNG